MVFVGLGRVPNPTDHFAQTNNGAECFFMVDVINLNRR